MTIQQSVDAVITWVDGYDKAHQQKLAQYFTRLGIERPPSAEPTRFNQCGEIDYCVRSILRFAPWISTIYIITDAQTPSLLAQLKGTEYESRIKIIDHTEIFRGYEAYLPTFNSLTIEAVMWRIPNLANRFIYFNDDCFLIRPVAYTDFFRDDKLVLRGYWRTQTAYKWRYRFQQMMDRFHKRPERLPVRDDHRAWQENCAQFVNLHKRFFHLPHIPFPLEKSLLADFFSANPATFVQTLGYALRHQQQIWAVSLAMHLAIQQQRVIFDNRLQAIAINPAFHSLRKIYTRLARAAKSKRVAFICMQSLDAATNTARDTMLQWMEDILTEKQHDHCNLSNRR